MTDPRCECGDCDNLHRPLLTWKEAFCLWVMIVGGYVSLVLLMYWFFNATGK